MLVEGSTWIVIVELVDEQVFTLAIFQRKTFSPKLKFVTVLFGEVVLVTIPLPLITLQLPAPKVGALAAKVATGELIQIV